MVLIRDFKSEFYEKLIHNVNLFFACTVKSRVATCNISTAIFTCYFFLIFKLNFLAFFDAWFVYVIKSSIGLVF